MRDFDNETDNFNVLRKLDKEPSITQRELSSKLGISLGKINYCLKELRKKGYKVKVGRPSKFDNRIGIQYDEDNERDIDGLISTLDDMLGKQGYRLFSDTNQPMLEAEFRGKNVKLNSPKRGGPKKFYVYVKNPKTGRIKKVTYGGTTGLKAKINNPKARKAFSARHNCPQKKDRTKASYWSCNLPRSAKQLCLGANKNTFW